MSVPQAPIEPNTERAAITLGVMAEDASLSSLPQLPAGYVVHDFRHWRSWSPAELTAHCRAVEVLVCGRSSPSLPLELANDFGRLRYVCHCFGTIRHVVPKPLVEAGLLVTNWGDSVGNVAEGAVALVLCMLKQLFTLDAAAHGSGKPGIELGYPATLDGRDVGLYGFGPIGRHAGRMLAGFGARLAVYDPYATDLPAGMRRCTTLRELFASCQVISIHCGLNDATRRSVTRELLDLLPPGGIIVNTARGEIVDEVALAECVRAGKLLAGIDVIEDESNWPGSPLAEYRGAVLTGHRVSRTGRPPVGLPGFALENLQAYRDGRPLQHLITAAMYDLKT